MSHTQEPWRVAEETFDNGGIRESVIHGLDDRAAIAVTLDFGPNNSGMREANARRIVACINACAGLANDTLENIGMISGSISSRFAEQRDYLNEVEKQRDALLAACEKTLSENGDLADGDACTLIDIKRAVASVTGVTA